MGLLDDAESFLCDLFDDQESVDLVIKSPLGNDISVVGTVGLADNTVEEDAYTRDSTIEREVIVTADQLVDGGNRFHPDEGTQVTEVRGSVTYVYETMNKAGRGAWSWHGSTYKAYRLHLVLVDEQTS